MRENILLSVSNFGVHYNDKGMDWDMRQTRNALFKYDKVEECIKIQCIFSFYYPVCVNQGTFVREPKVEQQQLKPPPPCPSMTIHLMCQDIR